MFIQDNEGKTDDKKNKAAQEYYCSVVTENVFDRVRAYNNCVLIN